MDIAAVKQVDHLGTQYVTEQYAKLEHQITHLPEMQSPRKSAPVCKGNPLSGSSRRIPL